MTGGCCPTCWSIGKEKLRTHLSGRRGHFQTSSKIQRNTSVVEKVKKARKCKNSLFLKKEKGAVAEVTLPHYVALINGVLYRVSHNYEAAMYLCIRQLEPLFK